MEAYQDWSRMWALEALRVLKPGAHLLAFGGPRTHHRLACAIEDAGFEIRESISWIYGSGFPKSLDVSKALDAEAGEKRGSDYRPNYKNMTHGEGWGGGKTTQTDPPITEAAKRWEGWGTALKPAHEPIVVARKALAGTVAQNVAKHGTGGLNVEGCRIEGRDRPLRLCGSEKTGTYDGWGNRGGSRAAGETDLGHWPPNLVLTHAPECGEECAKGCPVAEMDRQSGAAGARGRSSGPTQEGPSMSVALGLFRGTDIPAPYHDDAGGASRFFPCFRYEAKASAGERDEGLGATSGGTWSDGRKGKADFPKLRDVKERRNLHPTVKPVDLMRWLVRLVTPPGGLVLDPFAGSGSTGCAAIAEDVNFVGFENDAEYVELARKRLDYWGKIGHQMELF